MDVVYIVREGEANEELRYSLRSVAANFPHRQVVIAGYIPTWVRGVRRIPVDQSRILTKYGKAEANWQAAMNTADVSEDFIIFNDDFFVMQPVTELKPLHRGNLDEIIAFYQTARGTGAYANNMANTRDLLKKLGLSEGLVSYAVHAPMQMNKLRRKILQQAIIECGYDHSSVQMRTLYGNFWRVGGEQIEDVKATTRDFEPSGDTVYLSSSDDTFKYGAIGQYVRERFNEKCKYEA